MLKFLKGIFIEDVNSGKDFELGNPDNELSYWVETMPAGGECAEEVELCNDYSGEVQYRVVPYERPFFKIQERVLEEVRVTKTDKNEKYPRYPRKSWLETHYIWKDMRDRYKYQYFKELYTFTEVDKARAFIENLNKEKEFDGDFTKIPPVYI